MVNTFFPYFGRLQIKLEQPWRYFEELVKPDGVVTFTPPQKLEQAEK
jgi:hypothetical protein